MITSALGVLVGRRHDGKPAWTFIAGKAEPWETPAETAVREAREEASLDIIPGEILGRRVHPVTGRSVTYMAAEPAEQPAWLMADDVELAEVRWLSVAEAERLLPGMFGPVRDYLVTVLGSRPSGTERIARCEELFARNPDAIQPPAGGSSTP